MKIVFTGHVLYKMRKRKVEKVWVADAIRYPDMTSTDNNKYRVMKKLNGKTLEVIYSKEKYIKVITVFWKVK